jgi:hypothetical protein
VLSLSVACGSSSSSVTNNLPNADGTGQIAHLTVGNLGQLSPQFSSGLKQLADGLAKIPQLGQVAGQIINSIGSGTVLDAQIGPSESKITTDTGAMTAQASAQGAVLKFFNLTPTVGTAPKSAGTNAAASPTVSLGPLITVTVGDAAASASYDRHTGKSSGTNNASLVTVGLDIPGQKPQTFSVVPGVDQSIPPTGQALLTLKVGSGKTTTNPDGSVSSVADALSIAVLPGQAPGGKDVLDLQLAHAQAAAGGALATVTPAPHPPTLPFTGEHPWIPFAGLGFLGGALGLGFLAYRGGFGFGFRRS